MTVVTVFKHKKFGAQVSLDFMYCQKQLKIKILIKNGIIHVLKSILKEFYT